MNDNIFNPTSQEINLTHKVVVGLERISEVFKVLLWEQAKTKKLSPIQIQILIFITYHKQDLCNVSHLANEFNVTKPTISDAIRVLLKKELIQKKISTSDSRSYSVSLTSLGKKMVLEVQDFANPLKNQVEKFDKTEIEDLYQTISQLIFKLNSSGILSVQRTCFGCRYYEKKQEKHYCNLLKSPLISSEIRLDCPEFDLKN